MLAKLKELAKMKINGCVALLIIPIIITAPLFIIDKWKCKQVSRSFAAISHPPGTARVGFAEGAGETTGSGTAYRYLVGEVRTYSGNPKTIESFYNQTKVWNPWASRGPAGSRGKMELVDVKFIEKGVFPGEGFPYSYEQASGWSLPDEILKRKKLYIVYVLASDL